MKQYIVRSDFAEGKATLHIAGRTPSEARQYAQDLILAVKKEDDTVLVKSPCYEGFSSEWGRHVYTLRVVYGADPARSEEILRSLV